MLGEQLYTVPVDQIIEVILDGKAIRQKISNFTVKKNI